MSLDLSSALEALQALSMTKGQREGVLGVSELHQRLVFNRSLKRVYVSVHHSFLSTFMFPSDKIEGTPLKRRRVSFGGRLKPELFDENLPPNTPLKRGETPRRSLISHTPAVLKKIIKVRWADSLLTHARGASFPDSPPPVQLR